MPPLWANALVTTYGAWARSEEHTSELQSRLHLVCRLLLEKKKHFVDVLSSHLMAGPYSHFHESANATRNEIVNHALCQLFVPLMVDVEVYHVTTKILIETA